VATTLWDKFQASIRWLTADESTLAAVTTAKGAEPSDPAAFLPVATSIPTAAPSLPTDGLDVGGFATLDIGLTFGTVGSGATLRFYLYDGANWFAPEADTVVAGIAGEARIYLPPFDCESWDRIYMRVIAISAGDINGNAMPNHE